MSPSLIISIIATVISAIAIGASIWTHNRNHKLQVRIVALEEAREKDRLAEKSKANLTAKIIKEVLPRSGSIKIDTNYYLQIENKGSSGARDIKVMLDENPMFEHSSMCLEKEKKFEEIGPASPVRFRLFTADQLKVPHEISITWEDDSGEPGKYGTTLTL